MIWKGEFYDDQDGRHNCWTFKSVHQITDTSYITASFDFGFLNKVVVFLLWPHKPDRVRSDQLLSLASNIRVLSWYKWRIEGYDLKILKSVIDEISPLLSKTNTVYFERQPKIGTLGSGSIDFIISYYEIQTRFNITPVIVHPSSRINLITPSHKIGKKDTVLREIFLLLEAMGEEDRLRELKWHQRGETIRGVKMKAYDFSDALSLPFVSITNNPKKDRGLIYRP